jgi:hypothetical protein
MSGASVVLLKDWVVNYRSSHLVTRTKYQAYGIGTSGGTINEIYPDKTALSRWNRVCDCTFANTEDCKRGVSHEDTARILISFEFTRRHRITRGR